MSQQPPNQQPFNPQFPQQGPQGQYPQGNYLPQSHPQQSPMIQPASMPPKKKAWYKRTWGIVLIIFLALAACGGINNAFSAVNNKGTSNIATPTDAPVPTDTPLPTSTPTPQSIHYPPTMVADLRGLAAKGVVSCNTRVSQRERGTYWGLSAAKARGNG